jgi:large subunit ribosomal protein L21
MFAVVEIAGQQFKVQEGEEIYVHRLEEETGSKVEFDNVLLVDRDGSVDVGTPSVKATVKATILEHLQGDKVIVFKKKRRKGYRVKNGHRQQLTKVKIDGIA